MDRGHSNASEASSADQPDSSFLPKTTPKPTSAPGALASEIRLTVHSWHAQMLIFGRADTVERPPIFGLMGFADRVRVIWHAASADDPYADWWLIKIEAALERAHAQIRAERADVDGLLWHCPGLDIGVAESRKPYRIVVNFASPFGYRGAALLGELDAVACRILTARRVGLLDRSQGRERLHACTRRVRHVFTVPQRYRVFRIDRQAVLAGSELAVQAAKILGELPADVLRGERVATLTPYRRP